MSTNMNIRPEGAPPGSGCAGIGVPLHTVINKENSVGPDAKFNVINFKINHELGAYLKKEIGPDGATHLYMYSKLGNEPLSDILLTGQYAAGEGIIISDDGIISVDKDIIATKDYVNHAYTQGYGIRINDERVVSISANVENDVLKFGDTE